VCVRQPLSDFVAQNVLQIVIEQFEVGLERAVQPEYGFVAQRREVLDELRGRVGVRALRELHVRRADHVLEQVVRVLEQGLVFADEVVVDGARPAQPVDGRPVFVEHGVPGVGHELGELGERHVVAVPQRLLGGVGPVPFHDAPPESGLKVPGTVVPLFQFVPVRGQQPLERVPHEQELRVRGQHVGGAPGRVIAQPVQRARFVHHVGRDLRQVGGAVAARQRHEHPFPIGARHLCESRTEWFV